MKYNININQKALAGQGLDIKDCAILDYLYVFCSSVSPKVDSERVAGQTWINYQALIDDMPLLDITTRQALAPRIKKIEEVGYIKTKLRTKKGLRRLYVELTEKCDSLFFELTNPVKSDVEPVSEALHNHNTKDNNTKDNKPPEIKAEPKQTLPESLGKTRQQRILKIYSKLWYKEFNSEYAVNFGRFGKALKSFDSLSEPQVATLLFIHFNWYGMSGEDTFTHKRLFNAAYPLEWVNNGQPQYIAFLKNSEKVDFNNESSVYSWLSKQVKKLNTI